MRIIHFKTNSDLFRIGFKKRNNFEGKCIMNLSELRELNTDIDIKSVTDKCFKKYGKILEDYDFSEVTKFMTNNTEVPVEGNIYVASVSEMEEITVAEPLERILFGDMPCEIGYCNGMNSSLNGLEYHKSSEVNVAITDLVLLLGKRQEVENNTFDSSKVEAFYIQKGTVIEIYETTLHFAPCKVNEHGFKCVVILPAYTNTPIEKINTEAKGEERLLFMRNKWLIAHPERSALINKGAYPGIKGCNISVNI